MPKTNYREKRTIAAMTKIYCRQRHHQDTLCEECNHLLDYAFQRIDRCAFGRDKPACKDCPVHCYAPKMREIVKEVMRCSGPKMIYKHPVMAIMHIISLNTRPLSRKHTSPPDPLSQGERGRRV